MQFAVGFAEKECGAVLKRTSLRIHFSCFDRLKQFVRFGGRVQTRVKSGSTKVQRLQHSGLGVVPLLPLQGNTFESFVIQSIFNAMHMSPY